MADSVVSLLLDTLSRLLGQDDDLLRGVEEELRCFHGELSKISSILRDCEEKKDEKKATGLGRLISDVAYEAEDVIDTLAFNVSKQRTRSGLGKFVHGFGQSIMPAGDAAAATKIESFTKRIKEIESIYVSTPLQIGEGGTESPSRLTKTIGANEEDTLVERLTMGGDGSRELQVISIFGLCGAGKTTLAKKIYFHESVKRHFSCRAWVHISQNCTTEDVLLKILKCFQWSSSTEKAYNMKVPNEQVLKEKLSECLKDKRYLVVMDDIGEVEIWERVKSALPDGEHGSRILLTFQSESMASVADPNSCYSLSKLNPAESRELVQKIAFNESKCPTRLKNLVEQSAEKCDGFPLSLMLLGSLLERQVKTLHPLKVADDLKRCSQIQGDMLSFVYNKLPNHLSLCFLYLGMFPEGFRIPAKQLIQLWIAEGLIQEKGDESRTLEDVGEEYLEELTAQRLIQVASKRTDGGVKTCSIPDLFRDFAISKGREKKFLEVQDILNYIPGPKTRRLAIHFNSRARLSLPNLSNYLGVRSFHFSIQGAAQFILPTRHWNFLYTGFKLLKVLNLGMVRLSRVPKEVGKLIHLRYLRIKAPSAKHVPASICNLLNLQTLDMRESYLDALPNGIWKLEELRHLHLAELRTLPRPPAGSGASDDKSLLSLHSLSYIRPDKNTRRLMIKWKFPNVRKLKLASQNQQDTAEFLESLDHLHHLHSLKIVSPTSHLPQDPDAFPSTLTKLTLLDTSLPVKGSMKTLEKLPNLRILKLLRNSIQGPEINCSENGFPKLQVLHMVELMETKKWTMGIKAMGSLQYLVLQECVNLTMLPEGLWSVVTLRQVKLYWPSPGLEQTLQQLGSTKGWTEILVDPPQT